MEIHGGHEKRPEKNTRFEMTKSSDFPRVYGLLYELWKPKKIILQSNVIFESSCVYKMPSRKSFLFSLYKLQVCQNTIKTPEIPLTFV